MQSLRNKLEQAEIFLTEENLDIFCVSESGFSSSEMSFVTIPGYKVGSVYCRKHFLRGGTMVLVKNSLQVTDLTELINLSVDKIFECSG